MLKKILFLLSLIIISNSICFSQQDSKDKKQYKFLSSTYAIETKPFVTDLEKPPLLFDNSQLARIVIKRGDKSNPKLFPFNYSLLTKDLIVTINNEFLVLDKKWIDSIIVVGLNDVYLYKQLKGQKELTLLQVLVDGPFPLLKTTFAKIKKPDYNPVLMTGNKKHTVRLKDVFYVIDNGELLKLPKKSKKVLKDKTFSKKFRNLVKKSKPKLKKEKSIVNFFKSIN